MGKLFRYIADAALVAEDPAAYPQCHVCERTGVPVFPASGDATLPDGSEVDGIYVACSDCLRAGKVKHISEWYSDEVIHRYVEGFFAGSPTEVRQQHEHQLRAALRQTPRV